MKKLYKILGCVFLLSANVALAQDMHFTQFYSSPLYLNPAFTGANVCSRVALTYRNQWPGVSTAYQSFLLSADHYLDKYHLGIGLLLGNDEAGTGQLRTTIIDPSIAYEARINKSIAVRLGVQPGIGMRSINFNNLLFGDQIARGGNVPTIENPVHSKTYFDANAGALIYTDKAWVGISIFHINRPNESLIGDVAKMPVKFTLQGGYKFPLSDKNEKDEFQQKSFTTAVHIMGQSKFDQMDIGGYYSQYKFSLGLWYRGLPLVKAYKPGYPNNDAIDVVVGFQTKRMYIGYSYDITISNLSNVSNGAHEISISYQLCKPKKKKKYRTQLACPKF